MPTRTPTVWRDCRLEHFRCRLSAISTTAYLDAGNALWAPWIEDTKLVLSVHGVATIDRVCWRSRWQWPLRMPIELSKRLKWAHQWEWVVCWMTGTVECSTHFREFDGYVDCESHWFRPLCEFRWTNHRMCQNCTNGSTLRYISSTNGNGKHFYRLRMCHNRIRHLRQHRLAHDNAFEANMVTRAIAYDGLLFLAISAKTFSMLDHEWLIWALLHTAKCEYNFNVC